MAHEGKSFFVLGLGATGLPAAQFLQKKGQRVTVWDDTEKQRQKAQECGLHVLYPDAVFWKEHPVVVLSPGIPHEGDEAHPLMLQAMEAGCVPICDVQLFFDFFPHCRAVGITGSSGKSTTCSLLATILEKNGIPALWVGNGGIPIFDMVQVWQKNAHSPWLIMELSSYQLALSHNLPVKYGIVLNIHPHHLQRHKNMENYTAIKEQILSWATKGALKAIQSKERMPSGTWGQDSHEKKWRLWAEKNILPSASYVHTPTEVFYTGKPSASFSLGCNNPWMALSHNNKNLSIVWAILHMMDLHTLSFHIISSFSPLIYRQEHVKTIKNITYINDSKATSPASAAAALENCENIFWIVGGGLQDDETTPLVPHLTRVIQGFTIGESSPRYAEFLTEHHIPAHHCASMTEAVEKATAAALAYGKKSVILLSPACHSFDQFKNFEERGKKFTESVMMLWPS